MTHRPWPAPWLDWSREGWTFFATLPFRLPLVLGGLAWLVVYRLVVACHRFGRVLLAEVDVRQMQIRKRRKRKRRTG